MILFIANYIFLKKSTVCLLIVRLFFQPVDPHNQLEQVIPKTLPDELVSKGLLNFLPDHDLVHARMMLHAWEKDLEGVEDDACKLIIEATYVSFLNVFNCLFFSNRLNAKNSFRYADFC